MPRSMSGRDASALCIMAQGRFLMENETCRRTLEDLLQDSSRTVQRIGSVILGLEGRGVTAADRRSAKAFCDWADSLSDEIGRQARNAAIEERANPKKRAKKPKVEDDSSTIWDHLQTDII